MDELKDGEFNKIIDHYILTGTLSTEQYLDCTNEQKRVIQCLKRAFKRIISKQNGEES